VNFEGYQEPNKHFNLTYLCVTVLACATTAPPKTQVKCALDLPFGQRKEEVEASYLKGNPASDLFAF